MTYETHSGRRDIRETHSHEANCVCQIYRVLLRVLQKNLNIGLHILTSITLNAWCLDLNHSGDENIKTRLKQIALSYFTVKFKSYFSITRREERCVSPLFLLIFSCIFLKSFVKMLFYFSLLIMFLQCLQILAYLVVLVQRLIKFVYCHAGYSGQSCSL